MYNKDHHWKEIRGDSVPELQSPNFFVSQTAAHPAKASKAKLEKSKQSWASSKHPKCSSKLHKTETPCCQRNTAYLKIVDPKQQHLHLILCCKSHVSKTSNHIRGPIRMCPNNVRGIIWSGKNQKKGVVKTWPDPAAAAAAFFLRTSSSWNHRPETNQNPPPPKKRTTLKTQNPKPPEREWG